MREPGFSSVSDGEFDTIDEHDLEAAYRSLRELFEIDALASGADTTSLFAQSARNYIAEFHYDDDLQNPDVQEQVLLGITDGMRTATALLKSYGYEFGRIGEKGMGQRRQSYDAYEMVWGKLNAATEAIDTFHDVNDAPLYFAEQLLAATSGDRGSSRYRKEYTKDDKGLGEPGTVKYEAVTDAVKHEHKFFAHAAKHPEFVRRASLLALERLSQPDIAAWVDYQKQKADFDASMTAEIKEPSYKGQELDFTILPEGTNVREIVTDIISRLPDHLRPYVDLDRLNILDEIRDLVGKEKCFYAQGLPKGKEFVAENGERVDEAYIVLVMQDRDDYGQVSGENAIAISPIARRNAAFVCRYDVSENISWQEIFKFPKQDVELLGARRVKFTHDKSQDLHDAMVEKFTALLTCETTEFHADFRLTKDGSYVMKNRRALGSTAIKD